MTPRGLRLRNGAQELTLSTSAVGLVCLGRMGRVGAVVQPAGLATSDTPGRVAGYSKYQITSPTPILVAIDLPLNRRVGVLSVVSLGSNIWEATCYCGDTPDSYGFDTQYEVAIWAYGVSTKTGTRGLLLRNPATGAVAYDLSQPYPLFPVGSGVALGTDTAIVSLSRPVILGCPADDPSRHGLMSTNHYNFRASRGVWQRTGATNIAPTLVPMQYYEYFATEARGDDNGDMYNYVPFFMIEGTSLP